ncbi:MAG: hypothetical protein H5U28_10770 [Burkholderiaceae bacterium]|nr:hypothetical protein [Burkholderiaceae bacterium]
MQCHYQAVLLRLPGDSRMRLIVPAAPTDGDPYAEARGVLQAFLQLAPERWIAEPYPTHEFEDVEPKK